MAKKTANSPIQFRPTADDQAALARGLAHLREQLPDGMTATQADVLRMALHAFVGEPLCPYCDSKLVERKDSDGGTLWVWVCPECVAGVGQVVV